MILILNRVIVNDKTKMSFNVKRFYILDGLYNWCINNS